MQKKKIFEAINGEKSLRNKKDQIISLPSQIYSRFWEKNTLII